LRFNNTNDEDPNYHDTRYEESKIPFEYEAIDEFFLAFDKGSLTV